MKGQRFHFAGELGRSDSHGEQTTLREKREKKSKTAAEFDWCNQDPCLSAGFDCKKKI